MGRVTRMIEIPISQINLGPVPSVADPRAFRPVTQDLIDSIRKYGQLQPIVVFDAGEGKYQLIAGRRRVAAFVQMRAESIWAAILDERPSVEEGNEIWLSENLVRQLNEEDVASVIGVLLKKYLTVKALADKTGLPLEKVQRFASQ
jgi:ParB family transcriptional regulator, chromosome partitioning protein